MPTMTELIEETLNLLRNRSAQIVLKQIAFDTSVSYEWLCKFHQGKIKEPKHKKVEVKIQALHDYLVSKVNGY